MKLRPSVGEVVGCLRKVAADWDGLMPPCPVAEDVTSDSGVESSDSMKYCEFGVLILLRYCPSSNGTGRIYSTSSNVVPGSPTESQATSRLFSWSSTRSTQVITRPFDEPQPESQAPMWLRSEELRSEPRVPTTGGVFQPSTLLETSGVSTPNRPSLRLGTGQPLTGIEERHEALNALQRPSSPDAGRRSFAQVFSVASAALG